MNYYSFHTASNIGASQDMHLQDPFVFLDVSEISEGNEGTTMDTAPGSPSLASPEIFSAQHLEAPDPTVCIVDAEPLDKSASDLAVNPTDPSQYLPEELILRDEPVFPTTADSIGPHNLGNKFCLYCREKFRRSDRARYCEMKHRGEKFSCSYW